MNATGAVQRTDDGPPETMFEVYMEGYKMGYGVENIDKIDYRMARQRFERWWRRNR